MSGHVFTSMFAQDLNQYLAFKKSMGCYGNSRIWYQRSFDAYCTERGVQTFNRQAIEGWVVAMKSSQPGSPPCWMSYIRDFGRWMHTHGNPDAYVLAGSWKSEVVHSQPYLLSHEEISRFFCSAAEVETTSPWKWQAVAFFSLMHSCGLRTCETRRLQPKNVNLSEGFIDVVWSKGNRSRRLPITGEINTVLSDCNRKSHRWFGQKRSGFFVSSTGAPVSPVSIGVMFNRIWDQAGLPRSIEGKQPRPYDFRHHFAYANIERWMAEGQDVNTMLPYLTRYMGHADSGSTFYYVHTSPDFMAGYAEFTRDGQGLLPEVGFQ